ncbi:TrbC/VirB2 family protein [Lysobacter solisilvae (ex Woo and Kim 2020)]|uniref:TrbC/VirB2 family protein n=1 Tax=Agrilutibacter terrestris TaxID=2865112 RepID=A0A7H0FXW0_9GAMM|nr:TrbC/VirB2 family protein [Lysobacter terrestris]QNP40876.1 TrbC/VirB2 family protein [Lysobacter terrestris]
MSSNLQLKNTVSAFLLAATFVAMLALPEVALAQTAETRVEGFLSKVQGLLNIASVSIVTIAVIFAGYQIAFAHKRISDVAPILIGGFLIGAAAQLAKMVIPEDSATTTTMVMNALTTYA